MEEASEMPIATLLRTEGAPAGLPPSVPFSQTSTIVSMGRLESNQVALNDRKISKVHCRLIVRTCKRKGTTDGEIMKRIFIKDQSTFGTFVNGKALAKEQWTMLQENDVIGLRNPHGNASLGEYSVKYHEDSPGETGEALPAAEKQAVAAAGGLTAVKQEAKEVTPAPTLTAVKHEALVSPPQRPPLMAVKEEVTSAATERPQKAVAQLPSPPAELPRPQAADRPTDPRQQVKVEMGQEPPPDRPRVALPRPPGPKATLPAPASAKLELSAPGEAGDDKGGLEECSPLEEEEDGAAEPLSPLSEVSEVSADDGTVPQPQALPPGFLPPPGFPLGLPPGMLPTGIPTLPGLPGLPLGAASPAQLLAALRPGLPPLDATGRPLLPPPPTLGQMLPGINLANLPGGLPRPPAPPAPSSTAVALSGTAPASGASATGPRPQLAGTIAEPAKPVVINVQQELIGMLIGKGGEVVKQLSKDSGARIEISKSATSDGPAGERTVYLSGSQDCIDRAKQMIEDTLNKAKERAGVPNNPNACTIKVPHELVGMLIGRGGETIKELKKESGARVDIAKEATSDNCNDRLVHISGPPECVDFAKQMVEDMLSRARERQGTDRDRSRSPMRSERAERESAAVSVMTSSTQKTIKVAHELIGMLIGKGGDTIRAISKDSGCRIEIAKDEAAEMEEKRTVYLAGPQEAIRRAEEMIEDTLSNSRESRTQGGRRGGRRSRSRSRSRGGRRSRSRSRGRGKVMRVAQELIGTLIGRGGETIRQISKDTGARIEISKDDRDEYDRTVSISGAPDQIDKAMSAVERVLDDARAKMPVIHRPGRSPPRSMALALQDNDFDDLAFNRSRSPIKESYLSEKVYVDEVDMPHRPNFMPEHEDGLPSDLEIFVRGLPKVCAERDLWEHLYRLGATDVKEILLLRRQKQSKGMAYVVFNRHDHAMMAKHKMNNTPASAVPCGGQMPAEEKGMIQVRFSESERCINGRNNVYSADMVALLLGQRGRAMQIVKEQSGLRKVLLTGRNMKSYGQVDEDPRLHLVVYYEPDEVENVTKVIDLWGEQLGKIHMEIVDIIKGKGKGKGKFMDPMVMHFPPPPHMMDFPRPPFMDGLPPMRPPPGAIGEFPPPVEAPVLLQRRKLLADRKDGEVAEMTSQKVLEATCLRGRELRWQPWPEVAPYNEEWHALPMRWGLRGELFVLLRRRASGETKVCAAEVSLPLEKWPVLNAANRGPKTAKYKSFIFNEHLFLISLDRESGSLKVFHVPDPSSNWDVAFETSLPESPDPSIEGFSFSRRAKLSVFYAQDRSPHVLVVEPEEGGSAQLFKIVDPGKVWTRRGKEAPPLSNKARVLPVYTKTKGGAPGEFEVAIFSVDGASNELSIFRVFADTEKPWLLVSKLPFAGDTRLCCVYVPGKPEPLLMAGSPTERSQKLCHLNLIEWTAHKLDDRVPPPKVPVVEEKFSRQMSSLWPESRDGGDAQLVVATPIDCTADLPVSKHAWVTSPLLHSGELDGQRGPPGAPPGMPPGALRPPFPRSPFEDPWGPYGGRPPFDPRGPPPFGMPPPPFGRPPFDPMGKGGPPPGFDPHRPPFDMPLPGAPPPPGFERPPFDAQMRPPFDMPPPGMPPFERPPHGRPPFDMPPGSRPPFDAPPGEWFGGMRPPFDAPPRPDGRPPFPGPDGHPLPGSMEVGSFVEADFRDQGRFLRAKIIAKHDDGTFDIEYDGDYVEWKVPPGKIRPLPPFPGPPPGALGAPPAPPGGEPVKEKRRHRHRRGAEGEEGGEGGERRHHRHRRRGGEDRDGSPPKEAAPIEAPPSALANEEPPDGTGAQETAEDGGHRKRHRRRKREGSGGREEAGKDDREKEKERSKSAEGEPEQKKDRKRRHRSGERSRRHKEAKDGAADDSRAAAANAEDGP